MILATMAALTMSVVSNAKTVKTVIAVDGLCEMCKARIEKAAGGQTGVVSAKWNVKTKKLSLVYDNKKTSVQKVQKAIAAAGYDTERMKASSQAYAKLPGCCKYRSQNKSACTM